jgi:hypothetical protein
MITVESVKEMNFAKLNEDEINSFINELSTLSHDEKVEIVCTILDEKYDGDKNSTGDKKLADDNIKIIFTSEKIIEITKEIQAETEKQNVNLSKGTTTTSDAPDDDCGDQCSCESSSDC